MSGPLLPGTTFAGLRVESVLGRGGMGVVYRAVDPALGRPVALKLITPETAEDPGFRRRFLREPRLAASLEHPHVVPIYDAGEHDGQLYLAMRLVEGGDLKAALTAAGSSTATSSRRTSSSTRTTRPT
jgi:serine/threonine protein kinase